MGDISVGEQRSDVFCLLTFYKGIQRTSRATFFGSMMFSKENQCTSEVFG